MSSTIRGVAESDHVAESVGEGEFAHPPRAVADVAHHSSVVDEGTLPRVGVIHKRREQYETMTRKGPAPPNTADHQSARGPGALIRGPAVP